MKSRSFLGLCLSASLLLMGTAAVADKGKDKPKNARAMQVQLDKKTGKKLSAPDDSDLSSAPAAGPVLDTKGVMPVATETPRYHANGTISIKMGTENLEYLVLTIDKDGDKKLSHQKQHALSFQTNKPNTTEK